MRQERSYTLRNIRLYKQKESWTLTMKIARGNKKDITKPNNNKCRDQEKRREEKDKIIYYTKL